MSDLNVLSVIEKYLTDNKFDGLYVPGECACRVGDLMPCQGFCGDCLPGYLGPGNEECGWSIGAEKTE
jgi:hypothetical protein